MDGQTMDDARADLFDRLGDLRAGMLGVNGERGHMRPMTHYVDAERGVIHFLTSRQTDLVRAVGDGAAGHYCLVDDDDGYYACISGALTASRNEAVIDENWNPVAAAWFAGREDPDLIVVSLAMQEAEVWNSTDSSLHFGIEIVRANLVPDRVPDVGTHAVIRF